MSKAQLELGGLEGKLYGVAQIDPDALDRELLESACDKAGISYIGFGSMGEFHTAKKAHGFSALLYALDFKLQESPSGPIDYLKPSIVNGIRQTDPNATFVLLMTLQGLSDLDALVKEANIEPITKSIEGYHGRLLPLINSLQNGQSPTGGIAGVSRPIFNRNTERYFENLLLELHEKVRRGEPHTLFQIYEDDINLRAVLRHEGIDARKRLMWEFDEALFHFTKEGFAGPLPEARYCVIRKCGIDEGILLAHEFSKGINKETFSTEEGKYYPRRNIRVIEMHQDIPDNMLLLLPTVPLGRAHRERNPYVYSLRWDSEGIRHEIDHNDYNTRLRRALNEHRLRLFYQSTVPLQHDSGEEYGEILCRIEENNQIHPPGRYLAAAGKYLRDVDREIVRMVCQTYHQWRNKGGIAVNISGESVKDPNFLNYVHGMVETCRREGSLLDQRKICVELTEDIAAENYDDALKVMVGLKEMGFKTAIDDFGKGSSNLLNTIKLPADVYKIDGSLVKLLNPGEDPAERRGAERIIRFICDIAHDHNATTIAEWVETQEQAAFLKSMGVDRAQGFLYAHPKPLLQKIAA